MSDFKNYSSISIDPRFTILKIIDYDCKNWKYWGHILYDRCNGCNSSEPSCFYHLKYLYRGYEEIIFTKGRVDGQNSDLAVEEHFDNPSILIRCPCYPENYVINILSIIFDIKNVPYKCHYKCN
jgi:hypothetical protein